MNCPICNYSGKQEKDIELLQDKNTEYVKENVALTAENKSLKEEVERYREPFEEVEKMIEKQNQEIQSKLDDEEKAG